MNQTVLPRLAHTAGKTVPVPVSARLFEKGMSPCSPATADNGCCPVSFRMYSPL